MLDKRTFWKSDLWPVTACLLFAAAVAAAIVAYDAVSGAAAGGTARVAIIGGLALAAGVAIGCIDRSEAIRRQAAFHAPATPEASARWASKLSEEMDAVSGLNPDNSDRAKDAMSKDPPPIG